MIWLDASAELLKPDAREVADVRNARVLVIYGGWDAEMDVSLRARDAACESLASAGVDVTTVALSEDPELRHLLLRDTRCVLNLANGPIAEGGPLVALRELQGLPYVGSPAGPSALALDKHVTLLLARATGIPVPVFTCVDEPAATGTWLNIPLPTVAKPVDAGSSIDTVLCRTRRQLTDAVTTLIWRYGRCLVQAFLPGREFTVGVVDDRHGLPVALPPAEILGDDAIASTDVKYAGRTHPACPPNADRRLLSRLTEVAVRVHTVLGLRGYSRTDLRLDAAGIPRLLEVNHTPGLARTSWLPLAARTAGLTHRDLIMRLCANAVHSRTQTQGGQIADAPTTLPRSRRWVLVGGTLDTISTVHSAAALLAGNGTGTEIMTVEQLPQWLVSTPTGQLVIEATYGSGPEDAVVRAALDLARPRRTGPTITGAALAEDKYRHRSVLHSLGIPIPTGCLASTPAYPDPGPLVVKPRRGSQSARVWLTHTSAELAAVLRGLSPEQRSEWIVEEFIAGPEFVTGILGGDARPVILPTLRLPVADTAICTPEIKAQGARDTRITSLDARIEAEIAVIARRLHAAMGRPVLSRLDWRLHHGGRIRILEYDVFPGAGNNSYITAAAHAAGIDLATAVVERARTCMARS